MKPSQIIDHGGRTADEIDDRHWQSGLPRHFLRLPDNGVDLIVLAAKEAQPGREEIVWIKRQAPSLSMILVPMVDTEDESELPENARKAAGVAKVVAARLREGKRVLVTCAAGLNRSGFISALALMERRGISGKEAVERVQKARSGALSNATFARYIANLPTPAQKEQP